MPETPNFGLPYPLPPDPADVPADIKALADRLDELLGGVGRAPKKITLTGSGNYTPSPGCKAILVECIGGGGAGGSSRDTGSGQASAGGGGGGGAYAAKIIENPVGPYAYAVGAGGVGPPGTTGTGGVAGPAGGDTTFGANLVVAQGGRGGGGGTVFGPPGVSGGGGNGGAGSVGDVIIHGDPGGTGMALSGSACQGGEGAGAAVYGTRTSPPINSSTVGSGYGGGGTGAGCPGGIGSGIGAGSGTAGLILITEY